MKTDKKIKQLNDKYQEFAKKRMKPIKLEKSKKKAEEQLTDILKAEVVEKDGVFEIVHNGRLIRNSSKLEALKDLGTITGHYYE